MKQLNEELLNLNHDGEFSREELFTQYKRRMWLDNCDENKDPLATTYTYEEYTSRYNNWLREQFNKQQLLTE